MAASWYVIRSKPNKEDFLAGQLAAYGINIFYPRIQVKPVNPRARKFKAYFPSYLFIQVDLETTNVSTLQWMPGAVNLVSFDGVPASVPELLVSMIKTQVDQYNASFHKRTEGFQSGDAVVIESGSFEGYEAIFDTHISGQSRVRVLLKLLQDRKIPVEINSRQIKHLKRH